MKSLIIIYVFFLVSCAPDYEKNKSFPIIIINLDPKQNDSNLLEKHKIINVLNKLNKTSLAAVIFKPVFSNYKEEDSTFINVIRQQSYPVYSSSSIGIETGRSDLDENRYFTRVDLNINPSYRKINVPSEKYLDVYAGIGPENVMFRNSGKIESYYFVKSVNGKSFASLPLKLASDLTGIPLDDKRMKALKLSKYGSLALAFSDRDEYPGYTYTDFIGNEINYDLFKNAIVILAFGKEEHFTNGGIKTNAEITADAINQALIRLSKTVSHTR